MSEYILQLKGISKTFPGVKALDKVDLSIARGSVHVIVGENGAGKSTLMKIINGIYQPDNGDIHYENKKVRVKDAQHARDLGISMIFQELNVIPDMTVAENIYLCREPMRKAKFLINNKKLYANTKKYLDSQNLNYPPETKMKDLTVSQAQMIEIVKSISTNAKLIIMDEPTSAITEAEVDYLFSKIRKLKEQGATIIYISHKLDEIFRIADYISVFRDGQHIMTEEAKEFDKNKVITLMVGRELKNIYPKEFVSIGQEALKIENLTRHGKFEDISFNVRRGEILGISGLMGAGRTEVVSSIFGMDPFDSGGIFVSGKKIKIKRVSDAIDNGIMMLSENRRRYGLIPVRNVRENIVLVGLKYYFHSFFIKHEKEKSVVKEQIDSLSIKTPTMNALVANLSGGNQQKVVLAKWLLLKPNVLILDEPTRGIDVGAKHEIYKIMCNLAKQGVAIIMISSELPELMGMCDRMIVMSEGMTTAELQREEFTQEKIMHYATGGIE